MTKFRLPTCNPCHNKESKQKKHDKRDKNANERLFNTTLCSKNMADPVKPLKSYSAQINFDITI